MALELMKIRSALLAAAVFIAPAFAQEDPHWSYEGATGPLHWGELTSDYAMCEQGRNQAPIDIADALDAAEKPLRPRYETGSKDIVNNGHTVEIGFPPGNTLVIDDTTFTLQQMHFHAPSENQIAGRSFPLEAHLVHADARGNLLVVALMFEEGPANGALAKLAPALPASSGPAAPLPNAVTPAALLPKSLSYYRFSGSLTTPPCTEGVRWIVLKTAESASKAQLEAFEHAMGHHNNRPVQPLNGRVIIF